MLPIELKKARTHNLKNIDFTIRGGELVALTGPSGAGKSSLAIDTLYAEGQRRFVESFSPYARQFLERLERPPIDKLDPVAATVAVDRKAPVKSSRSTLATMADLEPYLSTLFGIAAIPQCSKCNTSAVFQTPNAVATRVAAECTEGSRLLISYPQQIATVEAFLSFREATLAAGFRRAIVNGSIREIEQIAPSEALERGAALFVVVDRVTIRQGVDRRLQEALEACWREARGKAFVWREIEGGGLRSQPLSRGLVCPSCASSFDPPSPGLFSYNSPLGACAACRGFGRVISVDWNKVIPDHNLSLQKGAIRAWNGNSSKWEREALLGFARKHKIPLDRPWRDLSHAQKELVLEGEGTWSGGRFPGVRAWFKWLETRTYKMHVRVFLARYREYAVCTTCNGARLNDKALSYRTFGYDLGQWHRLTVNEAYTRIQQEKLPDPQGERVREELARRLRYLMRVGLGYLSLDRQARTLSGGEAQRAGLTVALSASLTNALFVLDEPTVGLHPTDVPALTDAMRELAVAGNAVLVIEHDEHVVKSTDRVCELGPEAGQRGGEILFNGPAAELATTDAPSAIAWRKAANTKPRVIRNATQKIALRNITTHNLQQVDVDIPLHVVCAITGPSGSGKSSLAVAVLYRHLARSFGDLDTELPGHAEISGTEGLKQCVLVDQSPLGRTARGNAATYTKAWDRIRQLFAKQAAVMGSKLEAKHFSFNVAGGRCEACSGEGFETVEMQFLADVQLLCPVCQGKRFRPEVLAIQYRGRNVADILAMTVDQAFQHFSHEFGGAESTTTQGISRAFSAPTEDAQQGPATAGDEENGRESARPKKLKTVAPSAAKRATSPGANGKTKPSNGSGLYDPLICKLLQPARSVGLGYVQLGQPLSTLSGGEAQRLKLARALGEEAKDTLFIVDEPSAGLHALDGAQVVAALHALVERGASVLMVEHDLSMIRSADWVIDLGPDAGPGGGRIVGQGPPAAVAELPTRTGLALRGLDSIKGPVASRKGYTAREASKTSHELEVAKPTQHTSHDLEVANLAQHTSHELEGIDLGAKSSLGFGGAGPHSELPNSIEVRHAREHNLKDVSCRIPHGQLTVVTGPSGSGKSSLAFDVIFAEGQRRFMETLTPYARQFLPMLPRPDVDRVSAVPPSIALEQRTSRTGGSSTVATVTEVAHYLRLLFAKVGVCRCPKCDSEVATMSADDIFVKLRKHKGKYTLYAPAVRARKGTYLDLLNEASRSGLKQARIDGQLLPIDPPPALKKTKEHTIDLVVFTGDMGELPRELLGQALGLGLGSIRVKRGEPDAVDTDDVVFSTQRACPKCGTGVPELDPRWFSFNTQQGRCAQCEGSGHEPVDDEGDETLAREVCRSCSGTRLAPLPRRVLMQGTTYPEFTSLSVGGAYKVAKLWKFVADEAKVAAAAHGELLRRLEFIIEVGLSYLALDRAAQTLSGGEMQRLRLSAQLGSGLTGALYVLDEPTIGLHPRDTHRLIKNLRRMTEAGSTVLVVEHDTEVIRSADHILDVGPVGGRGGGHILAAGQVEDVLQNAHSPTAIALREEAQRASRPKRGPAKEWLELQDVSAHNLKNVTLRLPKGRLVVVAGVSGSGKSTLVQKVLYPAVREALKLSTLPPLPFRKLKGLDGIKRATAVDQAPIGRTPRSVPATFLSLFDELRKLYAMQPDAKARGYAAGRFSFNSASGGRCETCEGQGVITSEMAFLPDVSVPCEACSGLRFEPSTLDVTMNGLNIGDVLRLSAEEAVRVFQHHPKIRRPLQTLVDLGVGYLQLGQASNTLSGGEAQRLKLAAELTAGSHHEPTLYVLDEPTTGLHVADVARLIQVFERLVDRGDTLVVVEHHLDVIAAADHVVELGPEAGVDGGNIVFAGDPTELSRAKTATGHMLAMHLKRTASDAEARRRA